MIALLPLRLNRSLSHLPPRCFKSALVHTSKQLRA